MSGTDTLPVSSFVSFTLTVTEPPNIVCDCAFGLTLPVMVAVTGDAATKEPETSLVTCNFGLTLPVMVAVTGDAATKEPETSLVTNPAELTLPVNSMVMLLFSTTHEPVSSLLAGLPAKMVIGNKAGGTDELIPPVIGL